MVSENIGVEGMIHEHGTVVRVAEDDMLWGVNVFPMVEQNHLLGDVDALREYFSKNGYLFFRGFLDRDLVGGANTELATELENLNCLRNGTEKMELKIGSSSESALSKEGEDFRGRAVYDTGNQSESVLFQKEMLEDTINCRELFNCRSLFEFFNHFFGEECVTFDYKWVRAVPSAGFTGLHFDSVYMGRGDTRIISCWIPLDDIDAEQGGLVVCNGSNHFTELIQTYGANDSGWYSNAPIEILEKYGGRWETTDFLRGDIVMFGMSTLHASTPNKTERYRLSCDLRFQPLSEPMDPRYKKGKRASEIL